MKVGVLALQGCVEPHLKMLARVGAEAISVRRPAQLEQLDRIILPGGESTTMLLLMEKVQLGPALREFGKTHPVWGICAGSILIAQEVCDPAQSSLNLIPIRARRNFYGSQTDSFKTPLQTDLLKSPIEVDFIRAPLLEPLSRDITVHASHQGHAVLLQRGRILASSFHVELGEDSRLHEYFLNLES
ncbi:MAG: pyridoxal 5'-phosphate synthase glutaminase subunit PdxT [Deltaproteobacteria bacterium]|nr:pyridoxal 5'-phosphate synthase glutaminase subunit PdxT [Deltaproteobacteria bacterium]